MIRTEGELKEIGIHKYGVISTAKIPFETGIRKSCEDNGCQLYGMT